MHLFLLPHLYGDAHEVGGVAGLHVEVVEPVVEAELDVHVGRVTWGAGSTGCSVKVDPP